MIWLAVLCGIVAFIVGLGALLLFLAGDALREIDEIDE